MNTLFDTKWYSFKLKRAAVRKELAVSLDGNIIWVNGLYPAGSSPDVVIFRNERIIADRGYSDPSFLTPGFISSTRMLMQAIYALDMKPLTAESKITIESMLFPATPIALQT